VVSSYLNSLEFQNRQLFEQDSETEVIDLDDFSLYVAKDDPLIAPAIRAGYEPEVTQTFLEHLGDGSVIDIGANCGYFSLLAASRRSHVFAFEPLQANLRLLHASVMLNQFQNIAIIAAAASDSLRTLTIGGVYTNGIVAKLPENAKAALTSHFVTSMRVDDVVPRGRPISLVKVDTEGHEYSAVKGAARTIEEHRPVIISEFAPAGLVANSGRSGTEYLELLSTLGYEVSVIGRPGANTTEAILASCKGTDHVDILALPR
jgi:FkbM family methyltransferase